MRKVLMTCTGVLTALLVAVPVLAQEAGIPKNGREKVSYGIGVETAKNIKAQRLDVNVEMIIQGLKDELAGKKLAVPQRELRRLMTMFHVEQRRQRVENTVIASQNNAKKSETFLNYNSAKPGVVVLPSGLQYRIITDGKGKKPGPSDTVLCSFQGTLIEGEEFDGSEPGQPASLKINQAVPGLKEALLLMREGSKWEVVVPPHLGYGAHGFGRTIGPNETLIYEIELLSVK